MTLLRRVLRLAGDRPRVALADTRSVDIGLLQQRLEIARPALTEDPHRKFRPNMLESIEQLLR